MSKASLQYYCGNCQNVFREAYFEIDVSAIAVGGYEWYWLIKQLEKRRDVKASEINTDTYNVTYE